MRKQNLLGSMRHSIAKYSMIEDGDSIAVGLSGGKDSAALLFALNMYQRFSPQTFALSAITVDSGFPGFNTASMEKLCKDLGIDFHVVETDIYEVVFDIRKEKNPCSLCANMRRGVLASHLNKMGIKKLALGHHEDDLINTFFMNFFYTGRLKTLEPVSYLTKTHVTVIRPLIDTKESTIKSYVAAHSIPYEKSPCPYDQSSHRSKVDGFIKNHFKEDASVMKSMTTAIKSLIEPDAEDEPAREDFIDFS